MCVCGVCGVCVDCACSTILCLFVRVWVRVMCASTVNVIPDCRCVVCVWIVCVLPYAVCACVHVRVTVCWVYVHTICVRRQAIFRHQMFTKIMFLEAWVRWVGLILFKNMPSIYLATELSSSRNSSS